MIDANFTQQILVLYREYQSVEHSPPVEKIPIVRKIFQRLTHADVVSCITSHNMLKDAISNACLKCLKPETYSFVSQVAYKYFLNDKELIYKVKKVRNYIRHKKAHEKRRRHAESVLFNKTSICADVIGLVVAYV